MFFRFRLYKGSISLPLKAHFAHTWIVCTPESYVALWTLQYLYDLKHTHIHVPMIIVSLSTQLPCQIIQNYTSIKYHIKRGRIQGEAFMPSKFTCVRSIAVLVYCMNLPLQFDNQQVTEWHIFTLNEYINYAYFKNSVLTVRTVWPSIKVC